MQTNNKYLNYYVPVRNVRFYHSALFIHWSSRNHKYLGVAIDKYLIYTLRMFCFIKHVKCVMPMHLSAHSPLTLGWTGSMRMINEYEVGLKEKIHQKDETRSTGRVGEGLDSQLCHYLDSKTSRGIIQWRSWEGVKSIPRHTTGLLVVRDPSPMIPVLFEDH